LPTVGQIISGSRSSAYKYLPESVQEFDDGDALAERLRRHGLTDVRWHSLTFGIASLYVGTKARVVDVRKSASGAEAPRAAVTPEKTPEILLGSLPSEGQRPPLAD
jgi:hypothetical protein